MFDIRKYVKKRDIRNKLRDAASFLPDPLYLRLYYFAMNGHWLHLRNPKGYTEKLQWMKLHDQHPEYTQMVDKIAVRQIVEQRIGPGYSFNLLGQWKSFDEIDFDTLPNQFVLKCNHDSASTTVIRDKSELTPSKKVELRDMYSKRLAYDFSKAGREYPYKNVVPCILAEEYMEDPDNPNESIRDYKFFCFDGVPTIMFVATDRSTDCKFDFFDMEFNHLDIVNIHPNAGKPIPKPKAFDEMKELAAKLSAGIQAVRVDLYEIGGRVYFGEYTFFHGGGFVPFEPEEWERRLGDMIVIK